MHKFVISKREQEKFKVVGTSEACALKDALAELCGAEQYEKSNVWDADVNVLEITPNSFNRYFFRKIPA